MKVSENAYYLFREIYVVTTDSKYLFPIANNKLDKKLYEFEISREMGL